MILLLCIMAIFFPYNWWLNGRNTFSIFHCINVSATESLSYGELGDFVGGVLGTIIAGIACIYVYKTYISQKEELEKTNETAEIQRFETTFFNLIRFHKENLESIKATQFLPSVYNTPKEEKAQIDVSIPAQCLTNEIQDEDIEKIERLTKHLQGADAMLVDFEDGRFLSKYYYSPWFNGMCMILKYLEDNGKTPDCFYTKFFYSQITRPEWWFLYAIFQTKENSDSETAHFKDYVELAKCMHLFEFGYSYIVEKNSNIERDKIYEKNEF